MTKLKSNLQDIGIEEAFTNEIDFAIRKINDGRKIGDIDGFNEKTAHQEVKKMM